MLGFLWYGKDAIGFGLGYYHVRNGDDICNPKIFSGFGRNPKSWVWAFLLSSLSCQHGAPFLHGLFNLPTEMAVGLILVASCPGGTASNVVVFLAKANLALSVSLTLVSTILAIFLTPWLTNLYAGHYVPVDSWGLLTSILLIVLLPLLIGLLWKRLFENTARQVSKVSPFVSVSIYFINCRLCFSS